MSFRVAALFLPRLRPADLVRAYAVLGGVPAYLRQFDDGVSLAKNLAHRALTPGAFLYDEPRFLLLQELRQPRRYFSVLEAIAAGRTRQNEIAQGAGIDPPSLAFYLGTLRELGLIERAVPATEKHPHKSRRGSYRIADNYLRFWFRFVYPNRSLLEGGQVRDVLAFVKEQIDQFTGPAFEAICREHLWRLHREGQLGFTPRAVGGWWERNQEIDVVAVGAEVLLVAECKWTTRPVGVNILDDLVRKAMSLPRRGQWSRIEYALFSRSGFTASLVARAREEGVRLVGLADLVPSRRR